jgi:fibrillarin-like pre-rRNA processing protein
VVELRPLGVSRVFTDGRDLYTENLAPGRSVYGERLVPWQGREYRRWDPHRSKLAALLLKGWKILPLERSSQVLYLGAASGTTVSHISDLCAGGTVHAVEVSRRVFQKLLDVAEVRPNVLPILADAAKPDSYASTVGRADFLYQDVAQRDQASIFLRNLRFLGGEGLGMLMAKARSVDAARRPEEVYKVIGDRLREGGVDVIGVIPLEPFERDHAAIVIEPTDRRTPTH